MAVPIQWTDFVVPNGGIDETRSPQTISERHWTSAENVEPLFDGVRNRLGSAAENSVPLQAVAQAYESGTNSRVFTNGTSEYIAQGFQDASALSVRRVAARLSVAAGSPTGNVTAALYANNAGVPGTVVTGADFTDFSTVDSATVTASYRWYFWTLATPVSLNAATTYHLVLQHADASANTVQVQEVTTPSGYASGTVNFANILGTWTTVAAADLNFRIYSGAAAITAIADYKLSDGSTDRHLVYADGELYKISGGTMTAVSVRERQRMTANVNLLPSWAVGQDRVFLTNNTEIAKKFYVLSGVEYWENEGIAAPTSVITPSAVAGAGPVADTYSVDYRFWNNDIGQPSDFKYQGVGAPTVVTAGANLSIQVTGVPTGPVRENDRVTHIDWYVKGNLATVFRFVERIAIGSSTHTITATTPTNEAEYRHAVPPIHEVKLIAENRQFIGNISGFPYRLMFSDIIGATPYYESFPAGNFREFGKGDGDYITALAFIPPRTLVVGFKNSIWALDPRVPATSDRYQIAKGIGIAGHRALLVVGRRLFFISDADRNKGPYVWEGSGEPQVLPQIDDTFKALNLTRLSLASCGHLSSGENRFQWWTLCSGSGQTQHRTILVYDYALGAWTKYTKATGRAAAVVGEYESSGVNRLYLGGYDGVEYRQDTGSTDASTTYTGMVTLKAFDFGAAAQEKRLRRVAYVAAEQTGAAPTLSLEVDYGRGSATSVTLDHDAVGGTFTLGTSTLGGTDTLGGSSNLTGERPLRSRGKIFRPTIGSNSQWYLKGIQFGVQPTRRS